MKKLALAEIKQFLTDRIEGVKITSFTELVAALERIPGVNYPYVHTIDRVPLSSVEEQLKNNVTVLATLFDENEQPQPVALHVQYPQPGDSVKHDYEIGFRLGDKFVAIANGLFSAIVKVA